MTATMEASSDQQFEQPRIVPTSGDESVMVNEETTRIGSAARAVGGVAVDSIMNNKQKL